MSCHGKDTGELEECPKCNVLSSCVSTWNKNNYEGPRKFIKDIKGGTQDDDTNRNSYFQSIRNQ